MVEKSELRRVPVFADLPDDQLDWFISQSQELNLKAGDVYAQQGTPADAMFVILEGQLQGRGERGGETFIFNLEPGDVTGILPFSRMKTFTVSGRALADSRALRFPATLFPQLVHTMPELTQRLVGLMSDRIREITRLEQQQDRLASLGKLSAGLAHELNNPASAAKRAANQLRAHVEENQGRQCRAGKAGSLTHPESGDRKTGSFVYATGCGSSEFADPERSGRADRFFAAQSRAERLVDAGGRPGASGISSRRWSNRCSQTSSRRRLEPLWSGSRHRWRSRASCTRSRAAPRGYRTWSAPSRNTRTWTRRRCKT